MHVTIAAVGKLKAAEPEQQLITEFSRRLPWKVTFREVVSRKNLPDEQLKQAEATLLLESIPSGAKVIALDERGKIFSSPEFSSKLQGWQDEGVRDMAFLIGGAAGHGTAVRERADLLLSFGKMTWPHMLVRVMLIEQLYRAHTLQIGHPYHKV